MLNRWNANPVAPNPGLWLVESCEYSYEYWWEHISYAYLSNVKPYEYWWAEYFVQRQATPAVPLSRQGVLMSSVQTDHHISYAYISHVKPMECQPSGP